MDSNPRRLQLPVTLTPAFLVVPGHYGPPRRLALVVACWHSGALPPAGGHPSRRLNPLGCQGLGAPRATTLQTTRSLTARWLETALFTAMAVN